MNAILIEDEKLVAREFTRKLGQVNVGIHLIETLFSVRTALHWFDQHAETDPVISVRNGIRSRNCQRLSPSSIDRFRSSIFYHYSRYAEHYV
ncbi:hypothetical protein [Spirosoma fluminis]